MDGTIRESGFRAWINVIELCSAARAFELRWLFRAEESRFGNWRMARYHLLEMHPTALTDAAHRISSVQRVLEWTLSHIVRTDGSPVINPNGTRLCVLEIVKHLPCACLSPGLEESLYAKVQHLRRAPVSLSIRGRLREGAPSQVLTVNFKIDPSILGRPDLVLVAYVTRYTVVKLCSLTSLPDPGGDRLTRGMVDRIGWLTNGFVEVDLCDRLRTELFALPGAWPFASSWVSNS